MHAPMHSAPRQRVPLERFGLLHGWEGLAALGIAISNREHANSSGPMKFHTITIGRSDRLAAATDTRQKGIRTDLKQLE